MIPVKSEPYTPTKLHQIPQNPSTPDRTKSTFKKHDQNSTKNKPGMRKFKKSVWTPEQDQILKLKVQEKGPSHWALIATFLPHRSGKQCRQRWHNHLREGVSKKEWQMEQYWMLALCVRAFGRKWSTISQYIPGRSDNTIKNQWNCKMKPYREHFQKRIDKVILSPQTWTCYGEDEKGLLRMILDKKMNEKTTEISAIKSMIDNYSKLFVKGLQEFQSLKKIIDSQTVEQLQMINYEEEAPGELSAAISAEDSLFFESEQEDAIIPI